MEIEILEEKENPLLERREIRFKAVYDGETPSRKMVKGKLTAVLNADEKLTILDNIESEYGKTVANGYVKIYANQEAMKVEPKYKLEKNTFEEEADAGEEAKSGDAGAPEDARPDDGGGDEADSKDESKPDSSGEKPEEKAEDKPDEKPGDKTDESANQESKPEEEKSGEKPEKEKGGE